MTLDYADEREPPSFTPHFEDDEITHCDWRFSHDARRCKGVGNDENAVLFADHASGKYKRFFPGQGEIARKERQIGGVQGVLFACGQETDR